MLSSIGALLAGGTAGVVARWLVSIAVFGLLGGWLPWGTLAVNLSGCFLAGLFNAAAAKYGIGGPHGRLMLLTGFCGAFTTFSTLILELDALSRTAPVRGGAYVLFSVAAGLALLRAGAVLGGR